MTTIVVGAAGKKLLIASIAFAGLGGAALTGAAADHLLDCGHAKTPKEIAICGSFVGEYENRYGSVTVKKKGAGFDVSIFTTEPTSGRWTCEYSGFAQPNANGSMVVEYSLDRKFNVVLKKNSGTLTVVEEGFPRSEYCGMGGFIDGDYK